MGFPIASLTAEHRDIEAVLERFSASLASGAIDTDAFQIARQMCLRHYDHEEGLLLRLGARDSRLAAKLRAQHDEALEIAAAMAEILPAARSGDALYLGRRFLAIVSHNMIEEERDVFPLLSDV